MFTDAKWWGYIFTFVYVFEDLTIQLSFILAYLLVRIMLLLCLYITGILIFLMAVEKYRYCFFFVARIRKIDFSQNIFFCANDKFYLENIVI